MYIQQSDLFQGLSHGFVKKVMNVSTRESYSEGNYLFKEGEAARFFYVLLKGHVRLSIRGSNRIYTVKKPGEAFGWSSLVGRDAYSASAQCMAPTRVVRFDKDQMERVLEENPSDGSLFYRRLAKLLGHRLMETYKMIGTSSDASSYGTEQVVETVIHIT